MQEEKKWWKKFSTFQIVSFVLIILFVIAIIVTIAIIVDLKNRTEDTKNKNDELDDILPDDEENQEEETPPTTEEGLKQIYMKKIIDFKI